MKTLIRSLLALAFIAAAAPPSVTAQSAPATTARPTSTATPFVNRVLANGLEVIVIEDHSNPLTTVELAVRNGSFTEPPELSGLSHLFEHMFFRTNRAMADGEDYLRNIGELGINYNGTTREEVVDYYMTSTSANWRTSLRFLRDAVRYPLFRQDELAREREIVIGEIDRHESNPYDRVSKAMNAALFYKYPSRKEPSGNRQTVGSATAETMRLIQSRYYIPNNSALIVTGDAKAEDVFAAAQELYGDWPRGEDPFVKFPLVEHPPLTGSVGNVVEAPIQNVILNIGWQGPSVGKDNAATYAADVFSFILTQPDSRFQRAIVDKGLASGVSIGYYTQRNVGPIQIFAQTSPDQARAALAAIYAEVAHFNDPDYFTDQQLESAKALLEADDLFSREKLSEYSHTIAFWWSTTGTDYFRGYLDNLRRTSRADISRYVSTYIQGKPHAALALLSSEAQRQLRLTPQELVGK